MNAHMLMTSHGRRVTRLGFQLWRQVRDEFPAALQMAANNARQVGAKTRRDRAMNIREFIYWLVTEFPIHSVLHLKRKHIAAFCRRMESRGLKAATVTTKLAHLSVLFRALGKPQLLDARERLFSDPGILQRSLATARDKSIEAAGFDFATIYERAYVLEPRAAVQLALCWHFGLRVQEAWCFRPRQAVRDGLVYVLWGTKGGRKRVLTAPITLNHDA